MLGYFVPRGGAANAPARSLTLFVRPRSETMDYAIKLVVLSAATLAALAVGVSVLAMYRLVEPRRLAIISLVSAAIAATVYPWHGLRAESLPASFLVFLFLAVTAAASGIACLALTRRSEHPGLGGLEIVVVVAVIAALVPMVQFWFAGGFVALALIFGMH